MSRRKQRNPSGPPSRPAPAAAPTTVPRRSLLGWFVGGTLLALALLGGLIYWGSTRTPAAPRPAIQVGATNQCRRQPQFGRRLGFDERAVLDTQARNVRGMRMYQPDQDGQPKAQPPPYSPPSWGQAGYLGAPVTDRDGAVYVAPAPWISVLYNPPAKANTLYRVDPQSGEMTMLAELPPAAPPNPENVYGIVGLAYDCDSHSLFVSSVFGSSRSAERGRLFRVDLATKQVSVLRDGVDPFGIAVFNNVSGKRLYYAAARTPEVYSIGLDAKGAIAGEPRLEASFPDGGYYGDERARRVVMGDDGSMQLRLVTFDFTLTAPTDPKSTTLTYRYDRATDKWTPQSGPGVGGQ